MHKPDKSKDEGTLAALLERFEKYRLPRALRIKDKVDAGEALDDIDLEYLSKLLKDTQNITRLIDRNPEYQPLATKAIHLYHTSRKKHWRMKKRPDTSVFVSSALKTSPA